LIAVKARLNAAVKAAKNTASRNAVGVGQNHHVSRPRPGPPAQCIHDFAGATHSIVLAIAINEIA
jgi:hypothetical protein